MAYPTEIAAVVVCPTTGALGATSPTHSVLHDQYRTALLSIQAKIDGTPAFDLDTNTPAGSPLNSVYRIRHGFDNFLTNSIFGAWLAGTSVAPSNWTAAGGITVSRSTTTTIGSYSAQVVFNTANTGELYQPIPISTLVDYTFSCYVQRTAGTGAARLVAQDNGGTFTEFASVTLNTGGGWQLATLTVKPSSGTSMRFSIKSGNTTASTWLISECMFEESKGIASTWSEASLGDTFGHDVYGTMAMWGGVTNLPAPTAGGDAATKDYVDLVTLNAQTASYTLVLGDGGKAVEMNVATANNLTVPPNSSVAFPVGTVIEIAQVGAGTTTLVAGAGVTLQSRGTLLNLAGQYAVASIRKRATDTWLVTGDVA